MADRSGILVVGEVGVSGLRPVSLELVSAARLVGSPVFGVLFGSGINDAAAELAGTGVERVLVADEPEFAATSAECAATIILAAIDRLNPALVLMPSTTLASEYAPAIAARLGAPIVTDVFALRVDGEAVIATRPAIGGRLQIDARLDGSSLGLLSVRAGAFAKSPADQPPAEIEPLAVALGEFDRRVRVIATAAKEASGFGLETADTVVAGGRGLKDAASFRLVEDLARALGGAVGATRAVTDLGWRPHNEQIGQTGKTIAPKLYIAIGISGAVQHTVGMTGWENVVVINRDPDAPIFKTASFGVVGDLFEIVPALTAAISAARA